MTKKVLRVAAIQMACELNERERNLAKATSLIERAAEQGSQLVLLPEMMPGGYTLTEEIWASAEPLEGPTTQWMRSTSQRLNVYLGTTFLEVDGEDFFNAFVMTNPAGEIVARVRKNPPASFEAYFFTRGNDPHWFDTPLGRIGVGICFENALYERYLELHDADIDLYLRPFSGASFEAKFPIRKKDADTLNAALREGTAETARLLGIPVIMSNKVGRLITTLPAGFPAQDIEFPGFSAIANSDGQLLAQLTSREEGVVVATVQLAPERKKRALIAPSFGRWTAKMPWWSYLWIFTQRMGEKAYAKNTNRRKQALNANVAFSWTRVK